MNYLLSQEVLERIKKSQKILLNCHRNPDPDSIGCALSMYDVLEGMGKDVSILCPSKNLPKVLNFLKNFEKIQDGVDFSSFNFSEFDLFIVMDSSSWDIVSGLKDFKKPDIETIVIDHHDTNESFGDLNIVDPKLTSNAELLYLIFEDWGVELNKFIADCLLCGILGDTGVFRYPGANQKALRIAANLIDIGADKDLIVFRLFRSEPFNLFKFYSVVLKNMKIEKPERFVWSAIPHKIYKRLNPPVNARESSASLFFQEVEGTDFGIVIVEEEQRKVWISFRSRTGFDTSLLAKKLGGGGHIYASGAKLEGLPFNKALRKILHIVKKHVRSL